MLQLAIECAKVGRNLKLKKTNSFKNVTKNYKFHLYNPEFIHTLRPRFHDIRFEICQDIQVTNT